MDLLKYLILPRRDRVRDEPRADSSITDSSDVGDHASTLHRSLISLLSTQPLPGHALSQSGHSLPKTGQNAVQNFSPQETGTVIRDIDTRNVASIVQPQRQVQEQIEGPSSRPWLRDAPPVVASPAPEVSSKDASKAHGPETQVCSFWFHYGTCSRASRSVDDQTGRVCPYLHHLDPGMENVEVQSVPWRMHPKPCGLDRCPQGSGKESASARKERLVMRAGLSGNGHGALPSSTGASIQRSQDKLIPVSRIQKQSSQSRRNEKKRNLKRITRALESSGGSTTRDSAARHAKPSPRGGDRHAKETCFFWYHGRCMRKSECPLLHGLTESPSFVKPPPGYRHHVPCSLRLCPGDHVSGHRPQGSNTSRKRVDLGSVLQHDSIAHRGSPALMGAEDNDEREEWFLDGFPSA